MTSISGDARRRLARARRGVRRVLLRRRRLLAAVLAVLAVVSVVRAQQPPSPSTDPVLVAARDLDAGVVLDADDLSERRFAEGTSPAGRVDLARARGRTLAAPLRAGEPLTDVRLIGDGVLRGYPGLVALPLRIPDPEVVALLRPGDLVDVLATSPRGGATSLVAAGVPVLTVPAASASATTSQGSLTGRLLVVGVTPEAAPDLAGAAVGRFISVTLLH